MSPRGLFREIRPAVLAGLTILAVVLTVDLILYGVGTLLDLGFNAGVWGTYAAWASAIFPGMALMVTAHSWIRDRNDRERREVMSWASMIDRHNGGSDKDTTITNNSSVFIRITGEAVSALRDSLPVCKPGETKYFASMQGDIELEIGGHGVLIDKDCAVKYVAQAW